MSRVDRRLVDTVQDGDIVLAPTCHRRTPTDALRPVMTDGWTAYQLTVIPDSADGRDDHWIPVGTSLEDDEWVHDLPWPYILLVRHGRPAGLAAFLPMPGGGAS